MPVVLVTGDDMAVAQAEEIATSARAVVVKRAINVRAVELKPRAVARKEIEAAAREAVAGAKRHAPDRTSPVRVELQFKDVLVPEIGEAFLTIKRPASIRWPSKPRRCRPRTG